MELELSFGGSELLRGYMKQRFFGDTETHLHGYVCDYITLSRNDQNRAMMTLEGILGKGWASSLFRVLLCVIFRSCYTIRAYMPTVPVERGHSTNIHVVKK